MKRKMKIFLSSRSYFNFVFILLDSVRTKRRCKYILSVKLFELTAFLFVFFSISFCVSFIFRLSLHNFFRRLVRIIMAVRLKFKFIAFAQLSLCRRCRCRCCFLASFCFIFCYFTSFELFRFGEDVFPASDLGICFIDSTKAIKLILFLFIAEKMNVS